jgi:hypothetical protein
MRPRPSCAGYLYDLHVYDPAAGAWADLSAARNGTPPSPRGSHGFTSAGDKLYVHGGSGYGGEGGTGRGEGVRLVGAEAERRDVLPRDRRRGGQAGMGQVGRRDGRRADEGALPQCLSEELAGEAPGGIDAVRGSQRISRHCHLLFQST